MISGSLQFLQLVPPILSLLYLYIVDRHFRDRSLPPCSLPLHRLTYKSVGGVSSFQTVWASTHLQFVPKLTSLRRRIGSILNCGARPDCIVSSFPSSFHLTESSILPWEHLSAPVFFHTFFAHTGFGSRCLSPAELSVAFGLTSHLHASASSATDFLPLVPLQVLDSLLLPSLASLTSYQDASQRSLLQLAPPDPCGLQPYLPLFRACLPDDWRQVNEVAQEATKADDAAMDFKLWNDRILPF